MNQKQVSVLEHALRSLGATVVGALIALLSAPDVTGVLTKNEAIWVAIVAIPLLSALEKAYLRGSEGALVGK